MEGENAKNNIPEIKPLRTFQSDAEDALRGVQGSLAKIALAENKKRYLNGNFEEKPEKKSHYILIFSISIILIIFGIFGLKFFFAQLNTKTAPENPELGIKQIITTDSVKNIDISGLNRDQLISKIIQIKKESTPSQLSVTEIKLTEKNGEVLTQTNPQTFLEKLKTNAPNTLVRSVAENFVLGIHTLGTNRPFIILKTNYYQNAFSAMLLWERDLLDDLGPIFITPENNSTLSAELAQNNKRRFEDMVIKNRDARVLRDSSGKIILLYSFPDKNNLIITTYPETLTEIASRIISSKSIQ